MRCERRIGESSGEVKQKVQASDSLAVGAAVFVQSRTRFATNGATLASLRTERSDATNRAPGLTTRNKKLLGATCESSSSRLFKVFFRAFPSSVHHSMKGFFQVVSWSSLGS